MIDIDGKVIEKSYQVTQEIIDNLDDVALNDLLSGYSYDVNGLLRDIQTEAVKVLDVYSRNLFDKSKFNSVSNLGYIAEETLRSSSFNYFIDSCLPSFNLNWHNIEWGQLVQIYQYLCIIASRDHGKSHNFSFAYPLWKAYRYQEPKPDRQVSQEYLFSKEGMIITNEYRLGKKHLKKIREEVETNEILREKLMPNTRDGWAKEELNFKNGSQVTLASFGTSMRGPHPHWIVVDDFLDKSCLYSLDQRQKFIDTFNSEIMNMILKGGQVINVGTPFSDTDLFGVLKKSNRWKVFEYPAIMPDGTLLDETRHDLQELLDKRITQGPIIFSREILCKPVTDASTIFPYDMLARNFVEHAKICSNRFSLPRDFDRIVCGVDLARSANVGADFTVFTTIGIDEKNRYWILDITKFKGKTLNEQILELKRVFGNFRHDIIVVENNQMQQYFVDEGLRNNLPVQPHTTGVNKYDLDKGLPSLAIIFDQERFVLPRGNEKSISIIDELVSQLISITWTEDGKLQGAGEHDDMVMSLLMAVIAARKHTGFDLMMV